MLGDLRFQEGFSRVLGIKFPVQLVPELRSDDGFPALLQQLAVALCRRPDGHIGGPPSLEEFLGFRHQGIQHTLDGRATEAGGKERFAEVPVTAQNLLGTLAELAAPQPEHGGKEALFDGPQERSKRMVRQRVAGPVQQRVLVSLAPLEAQLVARPVRDLARQKHLLVIVQEIVRGLAVDPEQHVADRPQQGTLPGLILPVNHMQVVFTGRKREFQVGERTVGRDLQSLESHGVVSPFVRRASRMMARTSSMNTGR